jgi:hypothetical protein
MKIMEMMVYILSLLKVYSLIFGKSKCTTKKGLYTIEVDSLDDLVLYASDGRVYKNTHPIPGNDGTTLVFYHPENKASTYYLASSSGNSISGAKLDQDILVTQKSDETDEYDEILINKENVSFAIESGNEQKFEILSFTIYNPYSQALNFTTKFENETGKDKFSTKDFPASLPPGKSEEFYIIFEPKGIGEFSAEFTIQADGLGDFVLNLTGTGCA